MSQDSGNVRDQGDAMLRHVMKEDGKAVQQEKQVGFRGEMPLSYVHSQDSQV